MCDDARSVRLTLNLPIGRQVCAEAAHLMLDTVRAVEDTVMYPDHVVMGNRLDRYPQGRVGTARPALGRWASRAGRPVPTPATGAVTPRTRRCSRLVESASGPARCRSPGCRACPWSRPGWW